MKKTHSLFLFVIASLFAACSGGSKKVVIMASGDVAVNDKTIQLHPGFTHNEKEASFTDSKLTLTLQNTDGPGKTFDLTDNGVYLLNLQNDTLIGGAVNYGSTGVPGSITSDQLDHIIDSTKQLMAGQNADDKKTFFLPPFTIKKISVESNTKIVGSFKAIPYSVEPDGSGKVPQVIKFFTIKQKRETLTDLLQQREKLKSVH